MKRTLYILALIIALQSCTRDADIELPEVESTLSVSCFISPELDMTQAAVFWSKPVFTNELQPEYPDNLLVVIFGNGTTDTLVYNYTTLTYQLSTAVFQIVPGETYKLEVTAPNGKKVSGTTSVPLQLPQIGSFEFEVNQRNDLNNFPYQEYVYKMSLIDPTPAFNYYQVMYYGLLNGFSGFQTQEFKDDDALNNGQLYIESSYEDYGTFDGSGQIQSDSLRYIVINATEEYYRFHRTLFSQDPGNPFSEPVIVFSNIENGLGVFAGYRMVKGQVELSQ